MKNTFKRTLAICISMMILISALPLSASAALSGKTGVGMAEWALRAYNEKWKYVYGSSQVGKVDCSGLVRSYCNGQGGGATTMLNSYSSQSGSISSMPRVHGLILYASGSNPPSTAHMGVYVGKNDSGTDMAVDARSSSTGVVYNTVSSRKSKPWTKWFKSSLISYPKNGWVNFNGKKYYYQDSQFVVGVHKIDGKTYDFGKSGALKGTTTAQPTTTKKTTTTKSTVKTTTTSGSLKIGSRGDDVKKLQNRLIELGYLTGTADGVFGSGTETAVKAFQKQAGLTADGAAGKSTQSKLYASNAPKAPAKTTTPKPTTAKTTTSSISKAKTTTTATTKKVTTTVTTTVTSPVSSDAPSDDTEQDISDTPKLDFTPNHEKVFAARNVRREDIKVIHFGMAGDNVREVQTRLIELGYLTEEASGYFGSFTEIAVKLFQKVCSLEENGKVDLDTYVCLFDEDMPKKPDGQVEEYGDGDAPDGANDETEELSDVEYITVENNGDKIEIEKNLYDLLTESILM